jgi:hypothetical protein
MEFPLVPAGSLNVSVRERAVRVPQPAPEFSPPYWAAPNPALQLRTYKSAANTLFVNSPYLHEFELVEQPGTASNWGDIFSQTAKNFYQKTAASQKMKKHTVDLYV